MELCIFFFRFFYEMRLRYPSSLFYDIYWALGIAISESTEFLSCCPFMYFSGGTRWLRHYAASWKVAGSSPDEVDFLN
jgi:hypothetical protein